jgi:hypothetical protein
MELKKEELPFFPLFRDRNITWRDVEPLKRGMKESKYAQKNRERMKKYKAILEKSPERLETVVMNHIAYMFYSDVIKRVQNSGIVYEKLRKIRRLVEDKMQIHYQDLITQKDLIASGLKKSDILNTNTSKYRFFKKKSFSNHVITNPIAYGTTTGERYYLRYGDGYDWHIGDRDGITLLEDRDVKRVSVGMIAFVICKKIEEQSPDEISFKERIVYIQNGKIVSDLLNQIPKKMPALLKIEEVAKISPEFITTAIRALMDTDNALKTTVEQIQYAHNKRIEDNFGAIRRNSDLVSKFYNDLFDRIRAIIEELKKYDEKFGKQKEQIMAMFTEDIIKQTSKKILDKAQRDINKAREEYVKITEEAIKTIEERFNRREKQLNEKYGPLLKEIDLKIQNKIKF